MPMPALAELEKPVSCSLPTPAKCDLHAGSGRETKCILQQSPTATTLEKTVVKGRARENPRFLAF